MTETCIRCGEPITPEDTVSPLPINGQPVHWECGVRAVVGGFNHLKGLCSCCGGTLPPDPEGMTRREAALAAALEWQSRHL